MFILIELRGLIGFDYDLSDPMMDICVREMGFIFCYKHPLLKDSGKQSRSQGPLVNYYCYIYIVSIVLNVCFFIATITETFLCICHQLPEP